MTPEQHKVLRDFIVARNQKTGRISKEEFLSFFSSEAERAQIILDLIREACAKRSIEDLQSALAIGYVFGFSPAHNHVLCDLIEADWHYSHEDVVWALQGIGLKDHETIDALYKATQVIPAYLEYDEARALAVKAIWALGKIEGPEAAEKLEQLTKADTPILRENAAKQLKRRGEQG